MKGKAYILGLSVLSVVGVAALVSTTDLFAQDDDIHIVDGRHIYQIGDSAAFTVDSEESIEAKSGARYLDSKGLSVLPVKVLGMAGRGYSDGMGETMYWMDKSRPVPSSVREKTRGTRFPAVHEMSFHLFLTTEALPGRTLRSINPAVMVNNNARSFPPKLGARYELKSPVEFEDVEEPGVVVLRILGNRNQIIASRPSSRGLGRLFEN